MAKKERYERICQSCAAHYIFCNRGCSQNTVGPEPWHDAYCSKNCKDIYNICAGYLNNWLSPEVEAARLAELNLTDEYIEKIPQWMKDVVTKLRALDTVNSAAIVQAIKDEPAEKAEEKKEENNDRGRRDHKKIQYKNKPRNYGEPKLDD